MQWLIDLIRSLFFARGEQLRRITPEEVREAQQRTGLQLVVGTYGDAVGIGCPITMLARDRAGANTQHTVVTWGERYYGARYIAGFVCGFDGRDVYDLPSGESVQAGYADGVRCKEELADLLARKAL